MFKKSDVLFSGIKEKILIVLISILFLYTCFPYAVNSIALMLFVSLTLITNFQKLQILNKDKTYTFLILNLWIIFLAFTAIISENTDQSGKILLRLFSFTLITFIFLFFISKTIVKYKNLFFLAFVLGNFIFTIIIYYKAILIIENTCFPQIYYDSYYAKIKFLFSKPNQIIFSCFELEHKHSFFIHRVYNSMGFLFSLILIVHLFFKLKKQVLLKIFLGIIFLWFSFLIYHQFSVLNVFLTLTLIPIFLIINLYKYKKVNGFLSWKKITIGLTMTGVFCVVFFKHFGDNTIAKNQIHPAVNFVISTLKGERIENADERYEINKANLYLIKQSPLIGYGVGDVQDKLNNYYRNNEVSSKDFLENQLNSHNYYAFLILAGGILILLLFIFNLIFNLVISVNTRNWVGLFFVIIFGLNLLFENMLSRIHGIIFYSLFTSLFICEYLSNKKHNKNV